MARANLDSTRSPINTKCSSEISRASFHTVGYATRISFQPDGGALNSSDSDLRVKEWVSPPDGSKEVFFRNIMGVINDRQIGFIGNVKLLIAIFTVMKDHDNYPVIIAGPLWLRKGATHSMLASISFIGRLCGFKGTYEKYARAA